LDLEQNSARLSDSRLTTDIDVDREAQTSNTKARFLMVFVDLGATLSQKIGELVSRFGTLEKFD